MKKIFFLLIVVSFLQSCGEDNTEGSTLDIELQESLLKAANGQGFVYFTLPPSDIYGMIPQDPLNPITKGKVELGKLLYHETAFAVKGVFPNTGGEYSCASCHHAGAGFQSGLKQGIGEGGVGFGVLGEGRVRNVLCDAEHVDVQPLKSPTILNSSYQTNMLWNGQFGATGVNVGTEDKWKEGTPIANNHKGFEGLEIQAIAGMGVHRMDITPELVEANNYKALFDEAFPNVPQSERYNLTTAGLAIAAYERTVIANQAPFQKYLRGNKFALSPYEKEGAILFFGKAECVNCHTGPALNKMEFKAIGMGEFVVSEVFNYNPEDPARFGRASFTKDESDKFKFKIPQLYNIKDGIFYGHGATFTSIKDVVAYKNIAIPQSQEISANQMDEGFRPLGLTDEEVEKISAFIEYGLRDPNLMRYVPESLPSGACFPNNDDQSAIDLGCR